MCDCFLFYISMDILSIFWCAFNEFIFLSTLLSVAVLLTEHFGALLLEDLLCEKGAAALQRSFAPALSLKGFLLLFGVGVFGIFKWCFLKVFSDSRLNGFPLSADKTRHSGENNPNCTRSSASSKVSGFEGHIWEWNKC